MIRPVEALIKSIRRGSENVVNASTEGIEDIEFIEFLNKAQERLQSRILEFDPKAFTVEDIQSVVSNQAAYDIPARTWLGNRTVNVDFSRTGNTDDYYPLRRIDIRERNNFTNPDVEQYVLRKGQIILDPTPQVSITNGLRINVAQQVSRLDIKRFKVSAVTTSGSGITSLTLKNLDGSAAPLTDDTSLEIIREDVFFTVVDTLGNIKMRNIQFDSIDETTGVVTVTSGFTFDTGETIAADNFILAGTDATNRPEWPDEVERYLLIFGEWKALKRDSSVDSSEASQELILVENDILEGYKELSDDIDYPSIIDESFL